MDLRDDEPRTTPGGSPSPRGAAEVAACPIAQLVGVFKALGHPLRIRTLELLGYGERSVSELLDHVDAEQPHLSQQLAILRRAGIVTSRREGAKVIYGIADERTLSLLALARALHEPRGPGR